MMAFHEQMMSRCLELAKLGLGNTYPNPIVGCVITHRNQIIGEGYTNPAGQSHAEIKAIQSVKTPNLLAESTLYVTLEPCSFVGKTPACTIAIAKAKIPKVVIGSKDPNPKVNGKGIAQLQRQNIEVIFGIKEEECKWQNRRFFTFQEEKRPYVVLKWAQTANSFIATKNETQKWISNRFSKQLVHQWRTQEHAILVGKKTIEIDNPKLTARLWKGMNQPIRVVFDRELKFPKNSHFYDSNKEVVVFNAQKNEIENHIHFIQIDFEKPDLKQVLRALHELEIQSVLVEGGRNTLDRFIEQNLWDEARILQSNQLWEQGISAPKISGKIIDEQNILNDSLQILIPN